MEDGGGNVGVTGVGVGLGMGFGVGVGVGFGKAGEVDRGHLDIGWAG